MSNDKVIKLIDAAAEYAELAKLKAEYAKAAYLSQKPPVSIPVFPVYGQQWRPWAYDYLGYGSSTIGGYGCVVSSAASIVSHALDQEITPRAVNSKMQQVGGFVSGTGLFYFRKLEEAFPASVQFSHIVGCISVPAPIGEIDQWISEGNYCIVRVDFEPRKSGVTSHYLPLAGLISSGVYWVVDPWIGGLTTLPPAYSEEAGWDAARAIYKVVFYRKI